ncbi:Sterile alpha and TIR motif-containing protein tir-1 [Armadillidium nasatum]|uniref:Sterile alpha and TIR motif-containing protein tir-1 n=1 Tax=Armadillidium nasatum TaxID=96803 RepID=A0A5N5TM80_9CRUS|nr:Sterile alpha and TIR motif-containing protein tir-1 [Armadillidium nasatum]
MIAKKKSFEERKSEVSNWTFKDVVCWLENVGFEQYVQTFQLHAIDGPQLLQLTGQNLKEELHVQNDDDLERFLLLISNLRSEEENSSLMDKESNVLDFYSTSKRHPYEYKQKRLPLPPYELEIANSWDSGSSPASFEDDDLKEVLSDIRPEYMKAFLACSYLILSGQVSSASRLVFGQLSIYLVGEIVE